MQKIEFIIDLYDGKELQDSLAVYAINFQRALINARLWIKQHIGNALRVEIYEAWSTNKIKEIYLNIYY